MIDHACVFTRTGIVLWAKSFIALSGNPIKELIRNVFLEGKEFETTYTTGKYALKWTFENEMEIIFVIVYQKILQLLYIEDLLDAFKKV